MDSVIAGMMSNVDAFEGNPPYTEFQSRFLSILPAVTAAPSWLGSALIIYVIFQERRMLLKKTYHRIMLGLSTFDFLYSIGFTIFGGVWNIPRQASFFVQGARAPNWLACNISGFLGSMSVGSTFYTMSLMLYYILTIRCGFTAPFIARRLEPWMHFFSIMVAPSLGLANVLRQEMNPTWLTPGVCVAGPYPPKCNRKDEIDCTRGKHAKFQVYLGIYFVAFVIIVVSMVILIRKVRETEQKMKAYAGGVLSSHLTQTRATTIRALLYIVAYLLYAIPLFGVFVVQMGDRKPRPRVFLTVMQGHLFSVNQGLWNAIIYLQPRFVELTHPTRGTLWFLYPIRAYGQRVACCVTLWSCRCCCNNNNNNNNNTNDDAVERLQRVTGLGTTSNTLISRNATVDSSHQLQLASSENEDNNNNNDEQEKNRGGLPTTTRNTASSGMNDHYYYYSPELLQEQAHQEAEDQEESVEDDDASTTIYFSDKSADDPATTMEEGRGRKDEELAPVPAVNHHAAAAAAAAASESDSYRTPSFPIFPETWGIASPPEEKEEKTTSTTATSALMVDGSSSSSIPPSSSIDVDNSTSTRNHSKTHGDETTTMEEGGEQQQEQQRGVARRAVHDADEDDILDNNNNKNDSSEDITITTATVGPPEEQLASSSRTLTPSPEMLNLCEVNHFLAGIRRQISSAEEEEEIDAAVTADHAAAVEEAVPPKKFTNQPPPVAPEL